VAPPSLPPAAEALFRAHQDKSTGWLTLLCGGREAKLYVQFGDLVGARLGFGHQTDAQALLAAGALVPPVLDTLWSRGQLADPARVHEAAGVDPTSASELRAHSSAKVNPGEPMPGSTVVRTNARSGETANVKGTGVLGTVGPDEIAQAWARVLGAEADERPLLLVIEDLHDAAPTFIEILASTAELLRDRRVVILATARPEAAVPPSVRRAGTRSSCRTASAAGNRFSRRPDGARSTWRRSFDPPGASGLPPGYFFGTRASAAG
jgi:hypothetical protein